MKAIILNEYGPVTNLQLADIAIPKPGKDEVLIKVRAISINPVDVKTREGKGGAGGIKEWPVILGWDISGEVIETNSSYFVKGDEVFGMVNFPGHGKAYAEYVVAPVSQLALKPINTGHDEAAAACLAALTAWQNLTEHYKVGKRQRVLIHAGSGGVGHYAIQIAKNLGAYVITTSSADNKKFVLSLGADEHIDYKAVNFEDELSDIDFVLNSQNADISMRSLSVLKPGGTLISISSGISDEITAEAKKKGIKALHTMVKSSGKDMEKLAKLLENGKLGSHISETYALEDMQKAHTQLEAGRTVGKIVVKP